MTNSTRLTDRINADLKSAMLAGDKDRVTILRSLKSAVLYVEVAKGARDSGLPESEILTILSKESKKRQESADLYRQGGDDKRAASEIAEKAVIDEYLPKQLSDAEISVLIDKLVATKGAITKENMGATIAAVKAASEGAADGSVIARLVRERIT